MGFVQKAYGDNNLWNMESWVNANPINPAQLIVTNHGPSVIDVTLENEGSSWRVVATGSYEYVEPVINGGQVRGFNLTETTYKDGVLHEYLEHDTPVNMLTAINPSFQERLSWLSGDDLFVASPTADLSDKIQALAGNDVFIGYASSTSYDQFYGGSGTDTSVYQGRYAEYEIKQTTFVSRVDGTRVSGYEVRDSLASRDGTDLLNEVERLQFSDTNLALDTGKGEIAGSAYRIYKAAFDRTPDAGGLGFWINAMDDGASLTSVAAGFINSPEFQQLYGANVTDRDFVTKVYKNVLDRNPDQSGYDFWLGAMGRGATRADILASFSESPENIGNVADLIANGIQYKEWVG